LWKEKGNAKKNEFNNPNKNLLFSKFEIGLISIIFKWKNLKLN